MELVLIAFVGTLVIMAVELRDFVRRRHTPSLTSPEPTAVSDLLGQAVARHSVAPVEKIYDTAA
jgi:hypothetical protein